MAGRRFTTAEGVMIMVALLEGAGVPVSEDRLNECFNVLELCWMTANDERVEWKGSLTKPEMRQFIRNLRAKRLRIVPALERHGPIEFIYTNGRRIDAADGSMRRRSGATAWAA